MKFKIANIINKKNGRYLQQSHVDIEVTVELKTFVRNHYKRKRCTNKLLSRFMNEGITNDMVERFGLCKK